MQPTLLRSGMMARENPIAFFDESVTSTGTFTERPATVTVTCVFPLDFGVMYRCESTVTIFPSAVSFALSDSSTRRPSN